MTKWEAKRWWWIVRSICVAQFFVVASVAAAATVVVDDESNLQKSFSHTSNSARCCCAVIVVAIVDITVVAVTARQIMQATVVPVVEKCPAWILFGFFLSLRLSTFGVFFSFFRSCFFCRELDRVTSLKRLKRLSASAQVGDPASFGARNCLRRRRCRRRGRRPLTVWPVKNHQMFIKVAQKWFH